MAVRDRHKLDPGTASEQLKLRELLEKKKRLAAMVVHDLRSPLTTISGHTQLLESHFAGEKLDPSDINELLVGIHLAVRRALGLCAELLDVEELEEGVLEANKKPLSPLGVFEDELLAKEQEINAKNIDVVVQCDPSAIVHIDGKLMGRVLENLLCNALRYAKRNGKICFRTEKRDGHWQLIVGNTGPAIPAEERGAVFGRYHQVEARRKGARQNRGLGLYFSKLAIAAHGGTIFIQETEQFPTEFVIELPTE